MPPVMLFLPRSTFYANYLNIPDLLTDIEEQMLANFDDLYAEELKNGWNSNDFTKLFRHIKDHQAFYKAYFKMGLDLKFKPTRYDTKLAEQYYGSEHIWYHIAYSQAGITAIIKMWLADGCDLSPEELHEILKAEYLSKE